jgi:predicted dehydrogenase
MDYLAAPWLFRIRKAVRYVRLYGFERTLVKVAGQYHMKRKYTAPPQISSPRSASAHVGILGCGTFAYTVIAHLLARHYGSVIRACMDVDINRAASLCERYSAAYYTTDAARVIADSQIDTIFIASNHASHADYAAEALRAGKDVHIEKPHVVRDNQLLSLRNAMQASKGRVLSIGYNRSKSLLGQKIRDALAEQPGEMMQSWFIAGHELPENHWYYSESEGGRVLGNLCHWVEFVYQVMPPDRRFPITVTPTRSKRSDCDIAVTYTFGDGSIAALTFSAKGHTFEGVKERYAAHRGNILVAMDDFQFLRIDNRERISRTDLWRRDHGHKASIQSSYDLSRNKDAPGYSIQEVMNVGHLILRTRESLETATPITISPWASATPGHDARITP